MTGVKLWVTGSMAKNGAICNCSRLLVRTSKADCLLAVILQGGESKYIKAIPLERDK